MGAFLSGCGVCRGPERLNSHEESPLLLSCDFSHNGIRELLHFTKLTRKHQEHKAARGQCQLGVMCLQTDFREGGGGGGAGVLGLREESCLVFESMTLSEGKKRVLMHWGITSPQFFCLALLNELISLNTNNICHSSQPRAFLSSTPMGINNVKRGQKK